MFVSLHFLRFAARGALFGEGPSQLRSKYVINILNLALRNPYDFPRVIFSFVPYPLKAWRLTTAHVVCNPCFSAMVDEGILLYHHLFLEQRADRIGWDQSSANAKYPT
jgi:hypothetical protein